MLDLKNIDNARNFLIRELTRYGGVNNPNAYTNVERDIDACEDGGARAKEFWNIILADIRSENIA